MQQENTVKDLYAKVKELITLRIDYARLTLAERMTMLLTAMIIGFATLLLASFAIYFFSLAAAEWIRESIGMVWSCVIVGGFYLLLIALIFALRKPLIVNPLARFLSKLLH